MSGDAASLPCPICSLAGVFDSAESLRDRLIHVSTNQITCPVCQEEISGLDKLTIHLFSHVKLLIPENQNGLFSESTEKKVKLKSENETQKKPRSATKNRPSPSIVSSPMKYVKIYPKLPVVSLNPVPIIDISQRPSEICIQKNEQVIVKAEASVEHTNTICDVCGLQFVDKNILKMHRCLIHNIDDTTTQSITRYECHLCPKNFRMRGSLMVHLRVAHYGIIIENSNGENDSQDVIDGKKTDQLQKHLDRNDNKQWQCDVCKKFFTTKYFLKKHRRLHTGETPYACTQCNKTFTFQQSYHKHLLYHNDEKPHSCSFCGRAFKELSTLHNHQRIHTGEKPFECETCGKCFRQRVSYLVHRRIHTGVMPYKCTACEKSFRYKVSQRTHKCQAQPPGTVVRQTGDLVEKLKRKKQIDPDNKTDLNTNEVPQNLYLEISEANAELARTGAKLSLEDMETDNFRILAETFINDAESHGCISCLSNPVVTEPFSLKSNQLFENNIEELISSSHIEEKNVPSPSDILRNLCLSSEENSNDIINDFSKYL